jgi:hypothetical protein
MKIVKTKSDYDQDTILTLIQNDDSDIIIDIHGAGEFRIATSGGLLRGEKLVNVVKLFSEIIDTLKEN